MPLYLLMALTLAVSGVTLAALHFGFRSSASASIRIREEKVRKLDDVKVLKSAQLNGPLSAGLFFALALGLSPWLFHEAEQPLWRGAVDGVAVLLVYDFLYYLLHRYPFHAWPWLKRVHTIHHKARYPIAVDSLYLHPVETVLGVTLLMFCVWLVGPIHVYSFGVVFLVYTQLNITVHCGLDLPLIGYMSRKHDRHHVGMRSGNYASITPLPDLVFGTAE